MIELADFEGAWTVSRRIADHRATAESRFDGTGRFSSGGAGLLVYDEAGRLSLAGQGAFTATRRYCWRQAGALIEVTFDDGRPFHRFDPGALEPTARHLCGNDTYDVTYHFTDWPRWTARWAVSGPRKDYVMVSCYTPCAGAKTKSTDQQRGI